MSTVVEQLVSLNRSHARLTRLTKKMASALAVLLADMDFKAYGCGLNPVQVKNYSDARKVLDSYKRANRGGR